METYLKDLDRYLAIHLMGWTWYDNGLPGRRHADGWKKDGEWVIDASPFWSPSTSISDAFQVVEKMRVSHFKWFEMAHRPNGYVCNFVGNPKYTEFAGIVPLVVSLAAKKAREAQK